MRKIAVALLLVFTLALTLTACTPDTCDICHRSDVDTSKVEIAGKTLYLCDFCDGLEDISDGVSDSLDEIGDGLSEIGDKISDLFD